MQVGESWSSEPSSALKPLWDFTDEEIRRGTHVREIKRTLGCNAPESLLFAILCAIQEGINRREALHTYLNAMFAARLRRFSVVASDVDEALQHGINVGVVDLDDDRVVLTDRGRTMLKQGRLQIIHTAYWMRRLYTEHFVIALSAIFLVILAATKLWVGFSIGSDGMFTEGVENLADLIKVAIIALSLRLKRDRLGAILIIGLMIITGATLGWGAIEGLLAQGPIQVNIYAYLVAILSLILNSLLIGFKVLIGRMSGNLSLLSDAKDNEMHMKVTVGVIVGLTFAIFHFYFVDKLVALFIAGLILWEGIITLKELLITGEDISIDTIRLGAAESYDDKITDWLLTQLTAGPASLNQLTQEFHKGLALGYRYFDYHAIFGFHQLDKYGINQNIQQAQRSGLIIKTNDELSITNRGLAWYYKMRAQEFNKVADEYNRTYTALKTALKIIAFILILTLLIIYAPLINWWLSII